MDDDGKKEGIDAQINKSTLIMGREVKCMYAIQTCTERQIDPNSSNLPFSPPRRALSTWRRGACLLHLQSENPQPTSETVEGQKRYTKARVGIF